VAVRNVDGGALATGWLTLRTNMVRFVVDAPHGRGLSTKAAFSERRRSSLRHTHRAPIRRP
jgi:hypothetical protein